MGQKTIRLIIEGRVQGVAYRAWTIATANELGVSGWVRNLASGQVEAVMKGFEEDVDAMVALCNAGPPAAEVTRVKIFEHEESLPVGFYQKETV